MSPVAFPPTEKLATADNLTDGNSQLIFSFGCWKSGNTENSSKRFTPITVYQDKQSHRDRT
jgi:hypothetical protein